jgi:hypothetical protein
MVLIGHWLFLRKKTNSEKVILQLRREPIWWLNKWASFVRGSCTRMQDPNMRPTHSRRRQLLPETQISYVWIL